MKCSKQFIKIIGFIMLGILIICLLDLVFKPLVVSWNKNNKMTSSLYQQPNNTVNTLFLGTSHVELSISPIELYENYGISVTVQPSAEFTKTAPAKI